MCPEKTPNVCKNGPKFATTVTSLLSCPISAKIKVNYPVWAQKRLEIAKSGHAGVADSELKYVQQKVRLHRRFEAGDIALEQIVCIKRKKFITKNLCSLAR